MQSQAHSNHPEGFINVVSEEDDGCCCCVQNVGTYRGAAEICGVDPKTVKRKVAAWEAGELTASVPPGHRCRRTPTWPGLGCAAGRGHEGEDHGETVVARSPSGRLYVGSARNFRRLVAAEKKKWRVSNGRQRRPAVWTPGDALVIDWGALSGTGVHVFCAVLAWARVRFVRFARDETAATTFAMLAECFEVLGGVPAKVLADRMGCLKAGTVARW